MSLKKHIKEAEANAVRQDLLHSWAVADLIYSTGRYYQFLRFLLVGALNTFFGQSVFIIFVLCSVRDQVALLLATVAGVIFNYSTAKRVVFQRSGSGAARWKFILCYVVTFGLNALLLSIGAQFMSPILTQLLLALPIALLTFVLMRQYVFIAKPTLPEVHE